MTTFKCNNSVYIHLPKTAGNAISRLLGKNGLVKHGYVTPRMNGLVDPHANVAQIASEDQNLPRWTVFRHPISWFESYWSYKKQISWARGPTQKEALNFIDDRMDRQSLDETVKRCYADKSTVVEDVYEEYWDSKTIIALQENLYEYIETIVEQVERVKLDKQHWSVANSTTKKFHMSDASGDLVWSNESRFFSTYYNRDKSISDNWLANFKTHLKERV